MKRTLLLVLVVHSLAYGQNIMPEKVGEEVYKSFSSPHPYPANFEGQEKLVWQQNFYEKGASYIAFHFSKIEIRDGDYLIVRNPENTRHWKYTYAEVEAKENNFWSIHIYGEDAVIEIYSRNSSGAFGYEIDKIAKGFSADTLSFAPR